MNISDAGPLSSKLPIFLLLQQLQPLGPQRPGLRMRRGREASGLSSHTREHLTVSVASVVLHILSFHFLQQTLLSPALLPLNKLFSLPTISSPPMHLENSLLVTLAFIYSRKLQIELFPSLWSQSNLSQCAIKHRMFYSTASRFLSEFPVCDRKVKFGPDH